MMRKDFALRLAIITSLLLAALPSGASVSRAQTNATNQTLTNEASSSALPYFTEPAISPDRNEIAFVSGGDIWTVPSTGGEASLLVSHNANESHPLYSPDGRRLAFMSNRAGNMDIYILTFDTGDLQRLTYDDQTDQLDAWSPDGQWVYFSSASRDIAGMNDIFRMSAQGGTPMQVSADRYTSEFFTAPAPDGVMLAFTARGISNSQWWRKGSSHIDQSEIWTRKTNGANSTESYERITEGGARETWAMWSADGATLYYVSDRGGAQNIWSRALGKAEARPRKLTNFTDGRVVWANISYDGRTIVFERDFGIWRFDTNGRDASEVKIRRRGAPAAPTVERLRLTEQIQELALAPDGKKVAFIVRGEIFAASSTDGGEAQRITQTTQSESQAVWSPDSRKLVYVSDRDAAAHLYSYDFATNKETQLTNDAESDATPRYSPDGKLIALERAGREIRVLDAETKRERPVATANMDRPPLNSDRSLVWSPDNRFLAFFSAENRSFRNVYVAPVDGSASAASNISQTNTTQSARQGRRTSGQPVSFLANVFSNSISWSADGTFILFDSGQRTEDGQVARVDLVPRTPRFREDQFRDLFREETPRTVTPNQRTQETRTPQPAVSPTPQPSPQTIPQTQPTPSTPTEQTQSPNPTNTAPAPNPQNLSDAGRTNTDANKPKRTEIVFENIRRRLSLLPVGIDVGYQTISPDGKSLLMIASVAGQNNLYLFPLDELSREPQIAKQLTSTPGFKSSAQFSPDGKEIFYLENGRIQIVPVDGKPARPLAVVADMEVDFTREKRAVFAQAWSYLREHFYDTNFHGANWQAVRNTYDPRINGARTPDELRRLLQLMVGELNASHLGATPPASQTQQPVTGRPGLRFDREVYERQGRLRITDIIPLSPADLAREIKIGDFLIAVDGREITARTNLDELLNYKTNRRVVLTLSSSADGGNRREVAIRPVTATTEKGLLYRRWVEDNRAYVARESNNRLGYVHMFDMSQASLNQLYIDLDAENHGRDGVVIDVRNNNGGFVNAYAIDVFTRRGYLTMTQRGFAPAPARTQLGQRALEAPTILITNQHSLSDAEDFTEGYRSLHLGKTVGEPTAGWIIFTTNVTLIDGTSFRLPFIKITSNDGADMELNPRPVDVPVTRPIGETYTGRDAQLDAAVRELLGQIRN